MICSKFEAAKWVSWELKKNGMFCVLPPIERLSSNKFRNNNRLSPRQRRGSNGLTSEQHNHQDYKICTASTTVMNRLPHGLPTDMILFRFNLDNISLYICCARYISFNQFVQSFAECERRFR
ncbi:hypothetical protein DERF_005244 [Dermatophagoides farinae]|uniref:Uncharacterized protein n=1 Tax=Dermatophagoides farinae TaxID=6954 RepID=A0A922I326_DERFA|nr:hypothetical protein DERF_005244 [Dermatophagoides farinae]